MKWFFLFVTIVFSGLTVSAQLKKVNSVKSHKAVVMPSTVKVISKANFKNPQNEDTTITITLTRSKFEYLVQEHFDFSKEASKMIENYKDVDPFDNRNKKIVSQRILEDEGLEINYADGSKEILYYGGRILISADGRKSEIGYMQVSPVIPPSLPDDENQVIFLEKVSTELLDILSGWLNSDSASIANFKKGDGSNVYENINRRIRFLNYIRQQK